MNSKRDGSSTIIHIIFLWLSWWFRFCQFKLLRIRWNCSVTIWLRLLILLILLLNIQIIHAQERPTLLHPTSRRLRTFVLLAISFTLKCSPDTSLNILLGVSHELKRELIGTKPIVIPATDSIRHSKSSIRYEVCILTLVHRLTLAVCSLD